MADQAIIGPGAARSSLRWPAGPSQSSSRSLRLSLGFAAFSLFLMTQGKSPVQYFQLVWLGGFGSAFSWQNTLSRTAPLLFAALCVALPARLGLVVIGGEGRSCLAASRRGRWASR
jgi:general nucleoside transport system permease protein